jgi:RNA polymerase sigma factor (sigma-70 family)
VTAETLDALLPRFHAELRDFVRRHAGRLLRYEGADDLVQAVHARALERGGGFRYLGREPFLAWLFTVARSCLADRHAYWAALRRKPKGLLRLTQGGVGGTPVDPVLSATGPSTYAGRRESLDLAVRALALLPERDRDLVRWASEDVPLADQAARLGLSYAAADSAARRAVERFRKAFRIVTRR